MPDTFIRSLHDNKALFGIEISDTQTELLARYFELVQSLNPILHLVAPSSAEEFAIRHVLESLTLTRFFPKKERFADVGAGAGLPSIPCLIVREDLSAVLVEAGAKKSKFLLDAVADLGLSDRAVVENKQFHEARPSGIRAVTCRALDKFTQKLPRLLKWANGKDLYLFGGPNLEEALKMNGISAERHLMPKSEQRYLFVSKADHEGGAAASSSRKAALNGTPPSPV